MNALKITIPLLICAAWPTLAAEPDTTSVTLENARELGRMKSTFLNKADREFDASDAIAQPNLAGFDNTIGPALKKSCVACHGPESSEAGLRIDQLNPDLLTGADVETWREIYNVLSNSEMPPEDEPEFALADAERASLVQWLGDEMNKASHARRNQKEHSSFRRMTKYEYNYAVQDLLGLPHAFADTLPPETASEDGFKNSSELLQMSAMQFETYREIGLKALKRAIVPGERPAPVTYVIKMHEQMVKGLSGKKLKEFNISDEDADKLQNRTHLFNRDTGQGLQFSGSKSMPQADAVVGQTPAVFPVAAVLPRSNELKFDLDRFLPDEGNMRVRIRAGRTTMNPDEYASLQLSFSAHTSNNANFSQVVSERDLPVTAPADAPEFIHFDIPLNDIQRNPFRKLETKFPRRDEFLSIRNVSNANNRNEPLHVMIDYIEISAPFYEQWPPKSHINIFVESKNKSDEAAYGREVLTRFLRRVWRRSPSNEEVNQFMDLFANYRPGFPSFEDAMVEVLATALATPEFLYVTPGSSSEDVDEGETISGLGLASRLSFFLWSSIPDDELLKLAEQGRLKEPAILSSQVERMLADPRATRFSQNFVQQWLGLDGLDNATHISDSSLKEAMQNEPIAFFDEVLKNNRSVMDFLHSDYAVVNEQLARHYRIRGVFGPHFRKFPIEPTANRGGILTTAAVLAMNSDGKDSHPLKRGVWMLERILHDPPPPPPPDVPEVDLTDPEILKMTLKERIADHRNQPACISCHAKIDPWGIAFENYDAMGAFRTQVENKPVDATSELFNKQELAGMDGLKRYLFMDRQDQFARAMVHKMTVYALGRPLSFGDRADIDALTSEFRKRQDRLGDLIHLIVNSKIFNAR